MIKFPKQIAACSFVWGDRSFLATSIISWVSTVSRISTCPVKMKFLIAAVPCNNKNISSLFLTKFINLGKTEIILANASLCVNLLVFFKSVDNRSRTCYKMVESTTLITLYSCVGFIFSLEESSEDSESLTEPSCK